MITKITKMEWFMIWTCTIILSWLGIGVFAPKYVEYKLSINSSPSSETVGSVSEVSTQLLTEDPPGQVIYLPFKVTAYCPCKICCGRFADGVTASGYKIQDNDKFVAACPILFDFGDLMDVPGYGIVEVKDRGGKIKDFHIDVFFHTHQEAKEWGIQYLEVGMFLNDF